jgi:hypothetical protein
VAVFDLEMKESALNSKLDREYMTDEQIEGLALSDLRELTLEEEMRDNFRRMFQIMGLIYQSQIEIKNKLSATG